MTIYTFMAEHWLLTGFLAIVASGMVTDVVRVIVWGCRRRPPK